MATRREPDGTVVSPWARFGWMMAVVWMIFLLYPAVALVNSDAPMAWIVAGWTAFVTFAVLYVVGFIRGFRYGRRPGTASSPSQWVIFSALIACAIVAVPAVHDSALSFVPFIMSFASWGLPWFMHWITTIGGVLLAAACVVLPHDGAANFSMLMIIALLGTVNTISTWLVGRGMESEELGLQLATSEGREAVARDVHDLIGHSLTIVKLKSQLARRLIDTDPERAKAELIAIEELAAEAIGGVRATVTSSWSSTLPEQLDASAAALRSTGVEVAVHGDPARLSAAQSLTATWIVREATTNVLRHAAAGSVAITVAPGTLVLEDNGRGAVTYDGNGVRSMRERAAAAGARFAVSAGIDGGTRVEVTW